VIEGQYGPEEVVDGAGQIVREIIREDIRTVLQEEDPKTHRWVPGLSVKGNLENLSPSMHMAANLVGSQVDEVAILFPHASGDPDAESSMMLSFLRAVVWESEIRYFNSAYDNVRTHPIQSRYSVQYDFLSTGNGSPRLELMQIKSGVSPLHSALAPWGMPIAHFSFKCENLTDYEEVCAKMFEMGMSPAQFCDSTYGRFSYWHVPGLGTYLKPRVNLRDGKKAQS